jgi:hypothetical protein
LRQDHGQRGLQVHDPELEVVEVFRHENPRADRYGVERFTRQIEKNVRFGFHLGRIEDRREGKRVFVDRRARNLLGGVGPLLQIPGVPRRELAHRIFDFRPRLFRLFGRYGLGGRCFGFRRRCRGLGGRCFGGRGLLGFGNNGFGLFRRAFRRIAGRHGGRLARRRGRLFRDRFIGKEEFRVVFGTYPVQEKTRRGGQKPGEEKGPHGLSELFHFFPPPKFHIVGNGTNR